MIKRTLSIEMLKIGSYRLFWALILLLAAGLASSFWGVESFLQEATNEARQNSPIPIPNISLYSFPGIWHNLTYMAGTRLFLLFPAFVIILLVTNEYTFRTIRQNVIDGQSRDQIVAAKTLFVVLLSFSLTLFVAINGLILGLIHTPVEQWITILSKSWFLLAYFLEVMGFSLLAMMIGFLVQKSIFALGILFVYSVIGEPIAVHYSPEWLKPLLPVNAISKLIELPNSALMKIVGIHFNENISIQNILITFIWGLVFCAVSIWTIRKRNL